MDIRSPEINNQSEQEKPQKKRHFWLWLFVSILILAALGFAFFRKTSFIFSQMNIDGSNGGGILPIAEDWPRPEKDSDRINILLLGLRGADDPNGGLLTDTIILISVKKSTGQAAMISIPRDLYVEMPRSSSSDSQERIKEKINFAYAMGEEKKTGGGIIYSKAVVSNVSGLYIDYTVAVDFLAFKEIVDILDGVDVYLDRPFKEETQFAKEVILDLPAGRNHLDGQTALYFARSRYSTSDFDRARRQQKILLAIKDKALSFGFLINPLKILETLNTFGRHVRTDVQMSDIDGLIKLSQGVNLKDVRQKVFDTSEEGLLYASTSDGGAYILLPVGDNYDKIREASRNIFN